MVTYRSLAELENAHDEERRAARMRIDLAEEYIHDYRSRVEQVRESFYYLAASQNVADDPTFREELQRVSTAVGENVARAGHKIGELEEEYDVLLQQQYEQRERFLAKKNSTDERSEDPQRLGRRLM